MKKYVVYKHSTPDGMVYFGYCKDANVSNNFGAFGENYITTRLRKHILKFGWSNIEHKILFKNLSLHEAKAIKFKLVAESYQNGSYCINDYFKSLQDVEQGYISRFRFYKDALVMNEISDDELKTKLFKFLLFDFLYSEFKHSSFEHILSTTRNHIDDKKCRLLCIENSCKPFENITAIELKNALKNTQIVCRLYDEIIDFDFNNHSFDLDDEFNFDDDEFTEEKARKLLM